MGLILDPTTRNLTIGRIIQKDHTNQERPTAYIKHWVPIILTTSLCYTQTSFQRPKIKITNSASIPGFCTEIPQVTPANKKHYFLTLPLLTLRAQALADYSSNLSKQNPNNNSSISSSFSHVITHSCKFLDLFFLDNNTIIALNRIAHSLSQYINISFYTDSSCITDHSTKSVMGIGWVVTNPPSPLLSTLQFSCKAYKFLSSTKAEALALVSALAICPQHSNITIYIDSKCIINTFTYVRSRPSERKFAKINNFLIWKAIMKIIHTHSLEVSLIKVKAHSNDQYNDMADQLAKDVTSSQSYIDINPAAINLNVYFKWNLPKELNKDNVHPLVIDRNIHHAIADITNFQAFNKFLAHYRIEDIRTVTFKNAIDWKWTKEWFNHNPVDDLPTSRKLTKFRAWQMKNCSNLLPTMNILQKYNPDLFSTASLCWHCKAEKETNQHLWLCLTILKKIKPKFKQLTLRFIALVQSSADTLKVDISNTFKTNPIFSWSFRSSNRFLPSSPDHAFYLTYRGFCPNIFTSIFTKFFSAKI
ncbi:hypothetical protein RclHR1_02780016 [Rhizophagus clarus]|uniref:RNase H type-1 domain-containing protein n=1 Tax=Rhizophagus clarus TaxID=94130 RepID=A0A2Z6R2L2_9GLOM|nr:hypothetical protein RclHR1_02780016 [Rhizophagus clarus]